MGEKSYLDEIDLDDLLDELEADDDKDEDDTDKDDSESDNDEDDGDAQKARDRKIAERAAKAALSLARKKQESKSKSEESNEDKSDDEDGSDDDEPELGDRLSVLEANMAHLIGGTKEAAQKNFDASPESVIFDKKHADIMNEAAVPGFKVTRKEAVNELIKQGNSDQAIAMARQIIKLSGIEVDDDIPPVPGHPDVPVQRTSRSKSIKKRHDAARAAFEKLGR